MAFGKRFPKDRAGSNFPEWVEVNLDSEDEKKIEEKARKENIKLMSRCIDDAQLLFKEKGLKDFQSDIVHVGIALFEKLASHSVYWKEAECKDRFDRSKSDS